MSYTNSSLVSYTKLSPNHSGLRTHPIDRITPHCVVGQLTAESIAGCFESPAKEASCNYGIGRDGGICLVVEEKNRSWCSSSNENDQRAVTVECASDLTDPYAMTDAVYSSLVKLCADICQRNGKKKLLWLGDKERTLSYSPAPDEMMLTVHRWFANKSCPGDWLYSRLGNLAAEVTAILGDTEQVRFNEMFSNLRSELQKRDGSPWSREARDWAVSSGLVAGGTPNSDGSPNFMWEDFLTREQLVSVLYRFSKTLR